MLSLIIEGIALIVTAAFILLCIYVKKAIVKPIRKISNELNNFSEGILSAEFDVKINDSDIGKLAGSLINSNPSQSMCLRGFNDKRCMDLAVGSEENGR